MPLVAMHWLVVDDRPVYLDFCFHSACTIAHRQKEKIYGDYKERIKNKECNYI